MKIAIGPKVCGFWITLDVYDKLKDANIESMQEEITIIDEMIKEDYYLGSRPMVSLLSVDRTDLEFIRIIEENAEQLPHVKIIDIPDDVDYYIDQSDDGSETIHEVHRSWN